MSASCSLASSASVLTNNITITNPQVYSNAIKIKQDKPEDAIYTSDRALLYYEETTGVKREAALASPIKGKKRLNSEVRFTMI